MAKYLVVIHNWFMDSAGFNVEEIEVVDEQAAHEKATWITQELASTFRQRAYALVALEPGMELRRPPRKLTWWERITGRIETPQNTVQVARWYDREITIEAEFEKAQGGELHLSGFDNLGVVGIRYLGSRRKSDNVIDTEHAGDMTLSGYARDAFTLSVPRLDGMYLPGLKRLSVVDYDARYTSHLFKFYCVELEKKEQRHD